MAERETKELYSKEGEKAYEVREDNYADCANEIMRRREQDFPGLTTTKLRGIYAHIVNLASRIGSQEEFEKLKGDLQYLKVKMAYEAGRESAVKSFFEKTNLMGMLDSVPTYDRFLLCCRYAESLVAYFKYYGGKD